MDSLDDIDNLPDGGVEEDKPKALKKKLIKVSREDALEKVNQAEELIKSAPSNLDLSESEELLKRAQSSVKLKAWHKGKSYAEQSIETTISFRNQYITLSKEYPETAIAPYQVICRQLISQTPPYQPACSTNGG